MTSYIGEHEHLLTIVKCRQLTWFGHVIRWKGSLANTLLQGGTDEMAVEREEDLYERGWITSKTGLTSTFISSSENRELGVYMFQVPSSCRPNSLQAMGHGSIDRKVE